MQGADSALTLIVDGLLPLLGGARVPDHGIVVRELFAVL